MQIAEVIQVAGTLVVVALLFVIFVTGRGSRNTLNLPERKGQPTKQQDRSAA